MSRGRSGKSRSGSRRRRRWPAFAGGVLVALVAALVVWPQIADAQDAAAAVQKDRAQRETGRHRKAEALERLCMMDTSASRRAILDLADSSDDATAATAIGALCREDFRGARDQIEDVFEDTDRSDFVRCTAIGALLHLRHADGDSWSDVSGYVAAHTDSDDAVYDMAVSVGTKLWGSEVSRD